MFHLVQLPFFLNIVLTVDKYYSYANHQLHIKFNHAFFIMIYLFSIAFVSCYVLLLPAFSLYYHH